MPVAAQSVRHVRDGNGDDARGRGDAAQSSSASERSTDDDFPDVRTDIRLAAGNLGRAETARPADDEQFLIRQERAAVILEISPHALIVRAGLRHDVGHEEDELVVVGGVGAVCGGAEVAAIEINVADAVVIGGAQTREIGRQIGVNVIGGVAPAAAYVARRQIPRGPDGFAQIVAVINGFDGALDEVMRVVVGVHDGTGGIAQLHLQRGINRGKSGARRKYRDESSHDYPKQQGFVQFRQTTTIHAVVI